MIDYLLLYQTDTQRSLTYPQPEGSPPSWLVVTTTVLPVTIERPWDGTRAPGSWMRLRSTTRLPGIEALPNCLLAVDTELAEDGKNFVYFHRFQPDVLLGQISPMFAGDEYIIPVGQPAAVLDGLLVA